MELASFHDADTNGETRTIEWHKTEEKICQRIKKKNKVQFDIFYSKDSFNHIFDNIVDVQRKLVESNQGSNDKLNELVTESLKEGKGIKLNINDLDKESRLDLFRKIVDSFSNNDFKQFNKDMEINASQHEKLCRLVGKIPQSERRGKKTYEQVLQLIYSNFTDNYFYSRDFKKEYNKKFNDELPQNWISKLVNRSYLTKKEVTNKEREKDDLYRSVKYKYKLSNKAMKLNYRYGGFTSKKNPNWREKAMYKEAGKT